MKWHKLGHETLDVAMDHSLVEETGRVRLSHELEKPSEGGGVRRLLRQDVVHTGLNCREVLWDIHKDLVLGLDKVKFLEEESVGILISQNEVKKRYTI